MFERSKEEQELTSLLSRTLVAKEVLEPMNKIGWGHGTPPAPDYSGQPAGGEGAPGTPASTAATPDAGRPEQKAEAAKTTETPKADTPEDLTAQFEALRDPDSGLILGKYKDAQAAIKGVGHAVAMAKQAFTERDEAKAALAKLNTGNVSDRPQSVPTSQGTAPRDTAQTGAPSRVNLEAAEAKLAGVLASVEEDGGVLSAEILKRLGEAQREVAEAAAEYKVREMSYQDRTVQDTERAQWRQVDEYMTQHHPESEKFVDEMNLHVQADPLLQTAIASMVAQGKRLEATEMAWLSFKRTHEDMLSAEQRDKAADKEADLAAREQVRNEKVEEARKDAGIVTGSTGGQGVHENVNSRVPREEIDAARDQMIREGQAPGSPAAMRFRHLVIGRHLPPEIFGPQG